MSPLGRFSRFSPLSQLRLLNRLKNIGLGVGPHGIAMLNASGTRIDFIESSDHSNFNPTSSNNRPNGLNRLNRPNGLNRCNVLEAAVEG